MGTLTVFKKLEKIFLVKRKKYFLQLVRGLNLTLVPTEFYL